MEDWKTRARRMHSHRTGIVKISERLGKAESEIRELFEQDEIRKRKSEKVEQMALIPSAEPTPAPAPEVKKKKETFKSFENLEPKVHTQKWEGNRVLTFALMGDTQFNSKYAQITHLHNFYDVCYRRGIRDVYHTGDIDDGELMRQGHQYECYTQGVDDHVEEITKNYPKREGIITHFITGNHDATVFKKCGADIGKLIAYARPDMHYLGRDCALIEITPHCIMELRHPWDGTAYALSYKSQKMIEAMEADSKPNILAIGHYHKIEYLFYRNVHCFQTGCFQSQTPFTRGKGISVHLGGWIVTVEVDENGYIQRLIPEMIPYYAGISEDYKRWSGITPNSAA
jgi:UDP-2,3-diacylglucosamine pyrophosphatase LpxH